MLSPAELATLNRSIDAKKNDRLAIVFDALADPNRCKMFRVFVGKKKEGLHVSDVARLLGISPSAASQHLKILVVTGLLHREREGQRVRYTVRTDDALVRALIHAVIH